jgi:anaerobic ribonucleoside-triphosphate reductase
MIRKVIKRNGDIVDFDFTKIKTAIEKAYKSCSKKAGRKAVYSVKGILENEYDEDRPVPVEEIQNLVESEIAKYDFDVAKAYILYREHHNVVRDWVDKKIAFI